MRLVLLLPMVVFLNVMPAQSQVLLEGTAGTQWAKAPRPSFEIDPARSYSLSLGYDLAAGHSLWVGIERFSTKATKPRSPGNESGLRTWMRSTPVRVGYRYTVFPNTSLSPFLQANMLVIFTRDEFQTDTPATQHSSTDVGADLEVGARWRVVEHVGVTVKTDYMKTGGFSDRRSWAIGREGLGVAVGLHLAW